MVGAKNGKVDVWYLIKVASSGVTKLVNPQRVLEDGTNNTAQTDEEEKDP